MRTTQQITKTVDALTTAANLDAMLTSAHSEIQRITTKRDALRKALAKLVNLSSHPYFVPQPDLPAWDEAIQQAREVL